MAYRMHLMVCAGTGCVSNRSLEFRDALQKEIEKRGLDNEIQVVTTGCNGFCGVGPLMVVTGWDFLPAAQPQRRSASRGRALSEGQTCQ